MTHPPNLTHAADFLQTEGDVSTPRQNPREAFWRDAWVEVSLPAVRRNLAQLASLVPPGAQLVAVVKANAYGQGAQALAPVIAAHPHVSHLAVATAQEALALRPHAPTCGLMVLNTVPEAALLPLATAGASVTVFRESHLRAIEAMLQAHPQAVMRVQVKLDTGMHRVGVWWRDALAFLRVLDQLRQAFPDRLVIEGWYTHFAMGAVSAQRDSQLARWRWVIDQAHTDGLFVPEMRHVSNTDSLAHLVADTAQGRVEVFSHYRVGIALWGYEDEGPLTALGLTPVTALRARIIHLQNLEPGEGVSYDYQFVARRPTTIATLPLGYADGIPRPLSNRMHVLVNGHPCPQVGNITMDQLMIDVTDCPADVRVGDVATLLGPDGNQFIGAEQWAATLGTIPYEILCGLGARLPRLLLDSEDETTRDA